MILNEIDQKAKDLNGNSLSLWNDPSVGMVLPIIHWYPASYGLVSFECDTEEHAVQLFQALQHVRSFEAEIPEELLTVESSPACVDCGTTEGVQYRTAFLRRLCFSCDRFRMQEVQHG